MTTKKLFAAHGLLAVCVLTVAVGATAQGASLKDFQDAEANLSNGERPCLTIPYSNIRENCLTKGEVVTNSCKTVQWRCTGDHDTNNVLVNIKKANEKLTTLQSSGDGLKSKLNDAKDDSEKENLKKMIEANEKEIDQTKVDLSNLADELADRKEKLRKRVEFGKSCISAREDARKEFENAIDQANDERDNDIQNIAQKLIPVWKASIEEHKTSLQAADDGVKICQEMADRQYPR